MRRVAITVEIPWLMHRVIKAEAKRWGMSLDQTVEDMLRRFLNKNESDERAMQIIRNAAALIEKRTSPGGAEVMSERKAGDQHQARRGPVQASADKSPPVPASEPGRASQEDWNRSQRPDGTWASDDETSEPGRATADALEDAWNDGFTAGYTEAFERHGKPSTPMPGMETTAQSRALILSAAVDRPDDEATRIIALLRDLDRALAENARLQQHLGEATGRIETDAKLIASHEAEIARLTAALNREHEDSMAYEDDVRERDAEIARLTAELDRQQQTAANLAAYTNRIAELEAEIPRLLGERNKWRLDATEYLNNKIAGEAENARLTAALAETSTLLRGQQQISADLNDALVNAREDEREALASALGSTIAIERTIADDRAASGDTEHEYQHRYAIEVLEAIRTDIARSKP